MNLSAVATVALISVATFGLLMAPAALRWRSRGPATLHLSLYLAVGLVWSIGTALMSFQPVSNPLGTQLIETFAAMGPLAITLVFGAVTLAFLERDVALRWYWGASLVLFAAWVIAFNDLGGLGTLVIGYWPALGSTTQVAYAVAITGWTSAMATALIVAILDFGRRRRQQFLNRLRYWLGAIGLIGLGNALLFLDNGTPAWVGTSLNIVGAVLTTYVVMRYHPPDLKILSWRLIRFLSVTVATGLVLFGAFIAAALVATNEETIEQRALLWIVGMAVGLALILPPSLNWIGRTLTRALFGPGYDHPGALRQYSQIVSNVLDMNRLGETALSMVLETMSVRRGALLIDERAGGGRVALRFLAAQGVGPLSTGYFSGDNPVIARFRESKAPLTHYDIDVLPQFKEIEPAEKAWLDGLDVELYVPVMRHRELIGVIALGSKEHGIPYLEEDLVLLGTLADQTAIALDNAKLFEQLASVKEEAGLLSERLMGLDHHKSEFLNIASHELRTPLTQIHGYASMLLEMTQSELHDPGGLRQMIEGIAKGSDRMRDVVQQMLEVSAVDTGQLQLFCGPVSLTQVVEQAVAQQATAIEQRQHRLLVSGIEELPVIEADGTRLVQALEHLVNNAIKYTPDGGQISLTGHEVTDPELGPAIELIVSDTGIGIAPENHERVFEKFYRVDDADHHSTSKTKFKGAGTGLGLSLVKGIVEAHGGRVWLKSPGYNEETCPGSQFFIRLPLAVPAEEPKMPESMIATRHWRKEERESVRK